MTTATPANRAVRLRLEARLELAGHGAELLRNKEEALGRERTRLQFHAARTEIAWRERLAEAATWLLRARALGAASRLDSISSMPDSPATVASATIDGAIDRATIDIAWQTSMGLRYPGVVDAKPAPSTHPTATAALPPTSVAYGVALEAGARHAAATTALRRVEAELANTRRRRRALEQRLEPRLRAELHQLDLALDERDRDAILRTKLAAEQKTQPRGRAK